MATENLNFNTGPLGENERAIKIIPKTQIVLPEFLAVVAGKKDVLVTTFQQKSVIRLIKSNFPKLIISCSKKLFGKQRVCAISRNKTLAEQTAEYLSLETGEQGKLLGYPMCCVEKHQNFSRKSMGLNSSLITHQASQETKKFNFLTNNLFNFYSRLGKKKENFKLLDKYYHLNEKYFPFPLWNLQFISHTPCKYDCKKSIEIGKDINLLLKKYTPKIEKIIKYTLSKPILFFDTFRLVVFDGKFKKDTLYYKKIIRPYFSLDKLLMDKIRNGNKIIVTDKKIKIFKDNLVILVYKKKNKADGFILNFSEN